MFFTLFNSRILRELIEPEEGEMKKIFYIMVVAASIATAHAAEPACKDSLGRDIYDADFCRAVQSSREVLELHRKMIKLSKEMQKKIEELINEDAEGRAQKARP